MEGSRSLAPVVGSGASNRAKRCRLAPCDYAIDRALPLAEIFTEILRSPVGRDEFDPTRPVTNMLKRAGEPAEAARAILFLASDDSSFIIGENLFVDGGTMAARHCAWGCVWSSICRVGPTHLRGQQLLWGCSRTGLKPRRYYPRGLQL